MNKTKIVSLLLSLSCLLGGWHIGVAADSGTLNLGEDVGATDYFKVTCSSNVNGNTDHLNFKIIDNSLSNTNDIPPQILNAHIYKNAIEVGALTANSNQNDELTLAFGNGQYKLVLDTLGTNTLLKSPQKYTFVYQCLNANGMVTKSSGFKSGQLKSIKNGKVAKYTVKCASNSKVNPPETTRLQLQLINQSALPIEEWVRYLPVLNAQVTKHKENTLNTSDLAGDLVYSNAINLQNGNGDYYISVNHTGVKPSLNNRKDYSFQYACMNRDNLETDTGNLDVIQDQ